MRVSGSVIDVVMLEPVDDSVGHGRRGSTQDGDRELGTGGGIGGMNVET